MNVTDQPAARIFRAVGVCLVLCALLGSGRLSGDARDADTVRGQVVAKTDTSLTIFDKLITTTLATTFSKEGKAITLKDVQVGDTVEVVTSAGEGEKLQAVSVKVLPKEKR